MATQPAVSIAADGKPDFITYERRDGVAWIMLDRPQYANAQNAGLLDQLDRAFRAATDDLEVKVIVLGGNGKHFSAGHDLGTPDDDSDQTRDRKAIWHDHVGLKGQSGNMSLNRISISACAAAGRTSPNRPSRWYRAPASQAV